MLFVFAVTIILKFALLDNVYGLERIVGGEEVKIEDYPYQLRVGVSGAVCGGALISEKYGLTAAHCVSGNATYRVKAGSAKLRSGGITVDVRSIVIHPNYNINTFDFDIAVLEFSTPFNFSSTIKPVKLPNAVEYVPPGTIGNVSGWGTTIASHPVASPTLRAVQVPVVDHSKCNIILTNRVSPRMFCAGYLRGGKDACQGDSGGPFVINGKLFGLVVWGYGCAKPYLPGVYTNVTALRSFIREFTGI